MAESKRNIASVTLQLCACVLNDVPPTMETLTEEDIAELREFSTFHSITALVCEGLERLGYDGEQLSAFREARGRAVRKNLLLDTERTSVLAFLEQSGIWYMPLKGAILKDLYPGMGLRQMSDNDILFDEAYRETVRAWFVARGYEAKVYGSVNHDVYYKPPVYYYEMHVGLCGEHHRASWFRYYRTVKERLVRDDDRQYGYHFTPDDFYIYLIAHGYHHYDGSGIGVRFLLDIYVYLQAYRSVMDFAYIEEELQKLDIVSFEAACRALALDVLGSTEPYDPRSLTPAQQELMCYLLTSGTHGTMKNHIRKVGRRRYLREVLFPGTETLRHFHPIFRHKLLMPVGWLYRAGVILFTRPARVGRVLKNLGRGKRK